MMTRLVTVLVGAVTLASPLLAETRYYVPLINAVGGTEPVPGSSPESPQTIQQRWVGSIAAFNGSPAVGTFMPIAAYGGFELLPNLAPFTLPTGTGASLFRIPWAAFTSAISRVHLASWRFSHQTVSPSPPA